MFFLFPSANTKSPVMVQLGRGIHSGPVHCRPGSCLHGTKRLLWLGHHCHPREVGEETDKPSTREWQALSWAPARKRSLAEGTGLPLCAYFYASFLPLFPTGHRRALEKGIQPQPPDAAPGTPAGAPGLGGKGPARAPGGAGEDAGSAGSVARYATSHTPVGSSGWPGAAAWGPGIWKHIGQGDSPDSATN